MSDPIIENRLRFLSVLAAVGAALTVLIVVLSIAILVFLSVKVSAATSEVQNITHSNQAALCALRSDVRARYRSNLKILREHKEDPIRVFGLKIPRATLLQSSDGQKSTLDALKELNCP